MALGLASELARAFNTVLASQPRTAYATETLARDVMEATSLAFWFTEPGIGVRTRVARSVVYMLNGARRTGQAMESFDDMRPGRHVMLEDVERQAADLGLNLTRHGRAWQCEGVRYPNYATRAEVLCEWFSDTPRVPYQVYSGVAHAESWGLQRGIERLAHKEHQHDRYQLSFRPFSVYGATNGVLGALIHSTYRTAKYLGANSALDDLDIWIDEVDRQLLVLRPAPAP